jgi:hypothetical protein
MKSKFKDLLEAGIVAAPSAFGVKPASNKPVSSQTGAFGGGSTPANDVQPGERPNPFTVTPNPAPAPAPMTPAPAPTPVAPAPAPVQPKFNPVQPFGPVIPTVPSVQPGTEYTPTPGSVKPGSTPTTPAPAPVAPAPATPTTPKPTSGKKTKTPTQYEVNRAASDAEFEKFKAFQARKQERASILAQTRQAEAELADNEPQTRTRGGGTGRGTGTSGRRIFENNTRMQFKPDALKSLLDLQEAGIADAISSGAAAAWDWAKQNIPYVKTASDKVKSVASDAWKYTSDPAYAAKTMIKYTTPTPGESDAVRFAKTLVGYSPDTIARMQARRGAAASAFDAATANEKLRHYEKMFAASNPASVLSNFAGMAGGAWQASLANKAEEAAKAGVNIKKPGFIENLATSIAGAAAGTGQDIVNAQVKAQAKEAARQKFAREDDWRVLTR